MSRLQSSISRTEKALAQIALVRKAYRDLVSEHKVLSTATEIGLAVLEEDPELLSSANTHEEK